MSKIYPVGIVGEVNYQDAIERTHEGEPARILKEPNNPYDPKALRVENTDGDTIGYIPKAHWLRDAIFEDGRGVAASIKSVKGSPLGVVIDVTLTGDDLAVREYGKSGDGGWLSRLLRR